jgi:hypothetical protein
MSYPENPDTVVVKNKFYPRGLTEGDVYEYYQKVKGMILPEVRSRDLMFFLMVEQNKPVVRRKDKGGKYIRLTMRNYDQMITGRTVSIHSGMGAYETIGIIDIDVTEFDGLKWARKAAYDVYNYVMDNVPIIDKATVRFTGKMSFHVVCEFKRKNKIDSIRFLLRRFLQQSPLAKVYTIEAKRRPGIPNLDLSSNKIRGNFITLHSLSVWGLRCMEVPYNQILRFDPRTAKIK